MHYTKKDAQMTKGLAIICMVALHLFCRQGNDVLGTPLLWLNESTPFVFLFGFFAEICVPLYAICAGYAQELLFLSGKSSFTFRKKRLLRLLINYWIVLGLFTLLALVFDPDGAMPGNLLAFLKSIVLLHSYNGAWWFLNTYVLLLLLPPSVLLLPVQKLKLVPGLLFCAAVHLLWYFTERFGFLPYIPDSMPVLSFVWKELGNLMGVLPCVWAGAFFCKAQAVDQLALRLHAKCSKKQQNRFLFLLSLFLFVSANIIHKSVLMAPVALSVFLIFNLWSKPAMAEKVFLFLGKHSTNIWLVHMFFYAYVFSGLVQKANYPVLMFAFMMLLCIGTSCVIMRIEQVIYGLIYHENKNHNLP